MTIATRRFTIVSAAVATLVLPACRTVDSTCERVAEVTEGEGKKIHNVACQVRVRELEGAERNKMMDCLNDASDGDGFRECFK